MGTQPQGVVVFDPHFHDGIDHVLGEDISLEQELVIFLEGLGSAEEGVGRTRNLGEFLGRKFIKVLVHRISRVNTVLDSIQPCKELGGTGQIRIGCGVWSAEFYPNRLGIGGLGGNTDSGTPIPSTVSEVNWRFVSWDESLKAVGGGVGDGGQGARMFDNPADVEQGQLTEIGIAFTSEEGLSISPDALVTVHS